MAPHPDSIVVDIDGTLAGISHRLHYIRESPPNYDAFFATVEGDSLHEWCKQLIVAFYGRYRIVLVSGRPHRTLEATKRWLAKHEVPYDELNLVRGDGDFRPDQELKRKWLHGYGKERILFTVDDRQRVVNMWRDEGLVCLQCDAWAEPERPKPRHRAPPHRLSKST
jgi:hypothetical protein